MIMFVGRHADVGSMAAFREFGSALGFAAASAGAEIVVGSDNDATLDAAVVDGAARCGRERERPVPWRLYLPSDDTLRFPRVPRGLGPPVRETFRSPTRWQAAHLEAVRGVDAVVAVGGHENTHRACIAAAARGRSVWPMPMFGGAAQRVYLTMISRRRDRHARELAAAGADLAQSSWTEVATRLMARILDALVGRPRKPRRVYFLSHARTDEAAADQVELFFHRKRRGVIRDEVDFPPGADLHESMRQAIASADDVIVLDSDRAQGRDAVEFELAHARALAAHDATRRIVGFLLDGDPPRTTLGRGDLHLLARDRGEREAAVDKAVRFEPKR